MVMFVCERHGDVCDDDPSPDAEYARSYLIMPVGFARIRDEDITKWKDSKVFANVEETLGRMEGFVEANGQAVPVINLPGSPGATLPSLITDGGLIGGGTAPAEEIRKVLHNLVDKYCDLYEENEEIHLLAYAPEKGRDIATDVTEEVRNKYNDASLQSILRLRQPKATA
jgi:hypothetical protein